MSTVISFENVSKSYRLGSIGGVTLNEDVARWWASLRGKPDPSLQIGTEHHGRRIGNHFLALDDVSFALTEGKTLGIVGRNGAGKSSLLKILSQVTSPTSGRIVVRGRIASLLEVGTGFHPDLTGRENIFLNSAILGMTKAEVRRKFDEIVAFSECEEFIDTPVKRYSSGMYVRLAFAVAAHLEPEILVIDEVLAVGDLEFQKKCLGKMSDVASRGRTVIVVSHNMRMISQLCNEVAFLQDGKLVAHGETSQVIRTYIGAAAGLNTAVVDLTTLPQSQRRGNGECKFTRFELINADGLPSTNLRFGEPATVRIHLVASRNIPNALLGFSIVNREGIELLGTAAHDGGIRPCHLSSGQQVFECALDPMILLPGSFTIRAAVFKRTETFDHIDQVMQFSVSDVPWNLEEVPVNHYVGLVHFPYHWKRW